MKQSEIGPAVLAGEKLLVGEFRDWQADERPDKSRPGNWHVFEKAFVIVGRDSIEVSKFVRDGTRKDVLQRPPFKVGERVVVRFNSFARTQFGLRCDGKLEALQAV